MSNSNFNILHENYLNNLIAENPVQPGNFKGKKTLRAYALDFVEFCGEARSTEIRKFMYELSQRRPYNTVEHRGWYSSYFSDNIRIQMRNGQFTGVVTAHALLLNPSSSDSRYLTKLSNGKYAVRVA
jgi:hypothetical protein